MRAASGDAGPGPRTRPPRQASAAARCHPAGPAGGRGPRRGQPRRRPPSTGCSPAPPVGRRRPPRRRQPGPSRVASGIDPDPRTTIPAGISARTSALSRSPNERPSGGPDTIMTSAAPAALKAVQCRFASAARRSDTQCAIEPASGPGSGCMMRTLTGRMRSSLSTGRRGAMTERRVRAYVGLGANLGDTVATLAAVIAAVAALPGVRLRGVSRLYATAPVGMTDQPEFRNAAVALDAPAGSDAAAGALALLGRLKRLETAFGRRPRRALGAAGDRSRPAGLRTRPDRHRAHPGHPFDGRGHRRGQGVEAS